jgi:predicted Zn-dependent protease
MKKTILALFIFIFIGMIFSQPAHAAPRGDIERASQEAYQQIIRRYGPATPVAPESQLGRIFGSLVSQSRRRDVHYRLSIINHREVNAMALPNGQIVVFSGLINALQGDPNSVAFVLGHEIAHIEHRHIEKRIQQTTLTDFAIRLLLGNSANGITRLGGRIVENLLVSGYSRGMEVEADNTALELMSRVGFDPRGALAVFDTFTRLEAQRTGVRIFPTHPKPADRRANVATWLAQRGYIMASLEYFQPAAA